MRVEEGLLTMVFSAVEMETPRLTVLMSCSLNSLDMLSSRSTFQVVSRHRKAYRRQPVTGEPLERERGAGTEAALLHTLHDLIPLK